MKMFSEIYICNNVRILIYICRTVCQPWSAFAAQRRQFCKIKPTDTFYVNYVRGGETEIVLCF